MSEALSSRSVTLAEVENALTWLADKWRYVWLTFDWLANNNNSPVGP